MKNFTAFADKLPKQGRWILVTDDVNKMSEYNMRLENLWLVNEYYQNSEKRIYIWHCGFHSFVTHWRYAIEEGG